MASEPCKGAYVLATKYSDGDPGDHWCVGFLAEKRRERFIVVGSDGMPFRASGFRRAKEITADEGAWILGHSREIASGTRSLWGCLRIAQREIKAQNKPARAAARPGEA